MKYYECPFCNIVSPSIIWDLETKQHYPQEEWCYIISISSLDKEDSIFICPNCKKEIMGFDVIGRRKMK